MKAQWKYGNIRVIYELNVNGLVGEIYLPPYLATRPIAGDLVESTDKQRFEIQEVIHILDGYVAAVKVVIGNPSGGTSASNDGGGSDIVAVQGD